MLEEVLCFVDTETTGLDYQSHEVWEIAAIINDNERVWEVPEHELKLGWADPMSLRINGYYTRKRPVLTKSAITIAREVANFLQGTTLVASNPTFDFLMLDKFLRQWNQCLTIQYRLIDIRALYQGRYQLPAGFSLRDDLKERHGIDLPKAHTALEDAQFNKLIYELVMRKEG